MKIKLLTKHHLEFLSLEGAGQARLSLHLSKYHIVGNQVAAYMFILSDATNLPGS